MNYLRYNIATPDATAAEIVTAELADLGFESFTDYDPETGRFDAYVQENLVSPDTAEYLAEMQYEIEKIAQQNWNAEWESNFSPIEVGERCYVRASFHEPKVVDYEVVITPKMSFGTGHHATTHMMIESLLDMPEIVGAQGLDMGCGTGILAILAAKIGAVQVDAIDIDEWAYENCVENVQINGVTSVVCPILGDAKVIQGRRYDFILANINRNILLEDMQCYVEALRPGGSLSMSGILDYDAPAILEKAVSLGLTLEQPYSRSGWACMRFRKVILKS